VDGVELGGARDALGDPPGAAHGVQRPSGGAGLAVGLGVHVVLHASSEDRHSGQESDGDAERQHHPLHPEEQPDTEGQSGAKDDATDHQRQQQLVFAALLLERLPELLVPHPRRGALLPLRCLLCLPCPPWRASRPCRSG
jgi:hypothetical protein